MKELTIDGIHVNVPQGWTLLEAARYLGIDIPVLCYHDGLKAWGGCRLCVVELRNGEKSRLVSSCTYPVEDGLAVYTASEKVIGARKMIIELLISQCPTSKVLQDLASRMGVNRIRFSPKEEKCIYCGLCVRMCTEQMMANAIGFINRGDTLEITTPYDRNSEDCRKCGGCIYVCPACNLRCVGTEKDTILCNGCYNSLQPTCIPNEDSFNCWMGLKNECGTCYKIEP